uniref:Methionine--tRNA ligase, cytoplasmic n=1 Tax=Hirondellea gigas TaxID=1518452 RepID=A0A6A7G2X2_9CRUS
MELVSQVHHPNGFKISLALNATKKKFGLKMVTGVYDGAALRVAEAVTGAPLSLSPNSAVLYLFSAKEQAPDVQAEEWLCWEATTFQKAVVNYLQSASSGREDKSAARSLAAVLVVLNTQLLDKRQEYFSGQCIGAVDVVFLSFLLLLDTHASSAAQLTEHPALRQYVDAAAKTELVKSTILSFYDCDSCSSIPLKRCLAVVSTSASHSGAHSVTAATQKTKQNKPVAASPAATPDPVKEERRISESEVLAAEQGWQQESVSCTKEIVTPVLPVSGERNILITSALPYVNNVPHLGNIIGCVLSADVFARFCRLRGDNVAYICGTDEYGTATETKAIAEGSTPKQICDKYHALHSDVYKEFNISFDHFGRTTTQSQTEIVHELFWDLEKAGNISRESVEQLYCDNCTRFLADRFVEGICPHIGCGYEDARGDQCDGCGKLVNAADLGKPRCKLCSATPRIKSSNHLFIDLPKIEPNLRKWFDVSSKEWSSNASTICNSWLRDGLLPRCITRDLKWGVPVPLEGYTDKVFYVWFDAPIGYLSITKEYTKDWEKWWKNPDEVQLYQFMAKDNVPFHGIIFPCTLIGSQKSWTRVSNLMATEYLNYEDGKFSKSRGVGVFGDQAMSTGIPSDVWRFYLLYIRPESQDTVFSWTDLQMKNNSELLNNLGNFVNRSLKFVAQFYNGIVPNVSPTKADFNVMASINHELLNYTNAVSNSRLRDGLRCILAITRIGNQYIQENEPYKLIKADKSEEDKSRGASVIAISANIVYLVALLLGPFMPDTSTKILRFLNKPPVSKSKLPSVFCHGVHPGDKVTAPEPLIQKITDEQVQEWQGRFKGPGATDAPAKKTTPEAVINGCPADPAQIKKLEKLVSDQGEKVRSLKAGGASKADVGPEVTVLLELKQQLALSQGVGNKAAAADGKASKKTKAVVTGGSVPQPKSASVTSSAPAAAMDQALVAKCQALVDEQGMKVRALKSEGASKDDVMAEVGRLLQLKAELATAQGVDPATFTAKPKGKKK